MAKVAKKPKLTRAEKEQILLDIADGKRDPATFDPMTLIALFNLAMQIFKLLFPKKSAAALEKREKIDRAKLLVFAQMEADQKAGRAMYVLGEEPIE